MAAHKKRRWPATDFSRYVRKRREDLGKSQQTVADALHLTQGYVSQLERGRGPSHYHDFITAYAEVLEVSPDVLWDLLGVNPGNRYSASIADLKPTVQGLARLTEDLSTAQLRLLEVMAREMAASNKQAGADGPPHTSEATTAPGNSADQGR